MNNIHANCVDIDGKGILILGAPSSGKSDLSLRLIRRFAARLVADDRCEIERKGEKLFAKAPINLAGLMEVRGLGIIKFPYQTSTEIKIVIELVKNPSEIERMPEKSFAAIEGCSFPKLKLYAFECSAPDKVFLFLHHLTSKQSCEDLEHIN